MMLRDWIGTGTGGADLAMDLRACAAEMEHDKAELARLRAAVDRYRATLQSIARGRSDDGRPLPSVAARARARALLIGLGEDWTRQGTRLGHRKGGST